MNIDSVPRIFAGRPWRSLERPAYVDGGLHGRSKTGRFVHRVARVRGKTVLASFLMHISYNTTLFAGIVIASHGLRDL